MLHHWVFLKATVWHSLGAIHWTKIFRAGVRKSLGVEWISTGPNGLVPFQSQNEFLAHLMDDVESLFLVLKLDDDFDGDINDPCVSFFTRRVILSRPFPDICRMSSNTTFKHCKSSLRAVNKQNMHLAWEAATDLCNCTWIRWIYE